MVECLFTNYVVVGSSVVAVALISDITPISSKDFLDIEVITLYIHCKRVCDMIKAQSVANISYISPAFRLYRINITMI